ncbi:class I SAM-dependent methyltransferase [Tropicimonas isoalkanivorans]|uniref:SAM-dependent methyltransferase, MidA family n=1 Tax=Tropicimonas isoalkanivorans TaxID=441112 RepID=A0A1I1QAW9_9RHOB|nr:SAM-dependent methyltransferase [Tropicimonas isoalkanivorans]SFD19229.1 SAM-dependent methyltransferase, MidA family [Tropicimonas isoalkanivorans]
MTPLADLLTRRIREAGPISVADFMAECLLHPVHGYYTTSPVFGQDGDFTTAPEISQMFGEVLGLAIAQSWLDQGRPSGAVLAELGPGRGTLMADALRATASVPGFTEAVRPHLVEASPRLRELQAQTLGDRGAAWHTRASELPEGPLFLLANEFLDALPIRQFLRTPDGWRERMVPIVEGNLSFSFADPLPPEALPHRRGDTRPGDIVEICPALPTIVSDVARRIAEHGGMAIFVDYGGWRSLGDTLQAVRDHAPVDPLATPGAADLTAHVDFEAVATAALAAGAAVTPMTPQGVMLERLGLTSRAQALAARITDAAQQQSHIAAHRRLTHPQEMGSLFKAIALYRPGTADPPGFVT